MQARIYSERLGAIRDDQFAAACARLDLGTFVEAAHEARFGDGALDIVRQACSYLDTEPDLAHVFVDAYLERVSHDPRLRHLMPLYIANDRMKFWSFFAKPSARVAWTEGKTFRGWAERYVDRLMRLI